MNHTLIFLLPTAAQKRTHSPDNNTNNNNSKFQLLKSHPVKIANFKSIIVGLVRIKITRRNSVSQNKQQTIYNKQLFRITPSLINSIQQPNKQTY